MSAELSVKAPRWGPEDDIKLLRLFRQKRGGVNPLLRDPEDIEAVRVAHWPVMREKTFANRFREKARDFCVSRTQDGHRARKFVICYFITGYSFCLLIYFSIHRIESRSRGTSSW